MELKEYIAPVRKWWWLIVLATLIATVSSYFATRSQPFDYRATTTLLVGTAAENPNPTTTEFWLAQYLATTYVEIAQRDTVRLGTMEALSLDWLPEFTVRVIPNTQLIEISVIDTDPARAQAVANEIVHQLILLTPANPEEENQQRQAFVNEQLTSLEARITETEDEIIRRQEELANLFSARQIVDTENQITALEGKLTSLQTNYAALLANTQQGAINALTVVEPAVLPTVPVGPNKLYTILLAAAIGLVLATSAAYLIEYLDDTLSNAEDVEKYLGLSTLGILPTMEKWSDDAEVEMLNRNRSFATEAYRVLRTNLQFMAVEKPLRSLLVTSSSPIEGKSLTAANLSVAVAQAGHRVILVDADLRRPRLHRLFGLQNKFGLTTAFFDDISGIEGLLQATPVENLRVLTSGQIPPNPAEVLGSARMQEVLTRLQALSDMVIFDSPPVIGLADSAILSAQLDGVLLVLDFRKTRRGAARQALQGLQQVGARVLGVVLNRIPQRSNGYYYNYARGYTYGAQGDLKEDSSKPNIIGRRRRRKSNA